MEREGGYIDEDDSETEDTDDNSKRRKKDEAEIRGDYFTRADRVKNLVPTLHSFVEFVRMQFETKGEERVAEEVQRLETMLHSNDFRRQTTWKVFAQKKENPPDPREPPNAMDVANYHRGAVALADAYLKALKAKVKEGCVGIEYIFNGLMEALYCACELIQCKRYLL